MSAIYTPLKQIVAYALDECGKSIREFDRAWLFSFRALVLLNQQIAAEPKSKRLPVSGNKTVVLPSDYVSWNKIGVVNSRGVVAPLTINNRLSTLRDNNPNRLSKNYSDIQSTETNLIYFNNFYSEGNCFDLSTIHGGMHNYGECRVDERNGVIVMSPDFKYDSILLEYVGNPQMDNDYVVQTCLQEAIIFFIKWKFKLSDRNEFYGAAIEGRRALQSKKVTVQRLNELATRQFISSGYGGYGIGLDSGGYNGMFSASETQPEPSPTPINLDIYATLIEEDKYYYNNASAIISDAQNKIIQLDSSQNSIVYTIDPVVLSGYTLKIRNADDTNGATIQTAAGQNIELMSGLIQSSFTLGYLQTVSLKSNGSKLIEI